MKVLSESLPEATDYFGIVRTLTEIADCIVVEHGAPGTMTYTQLSYNTINRERLHGRIFSSGVDERDIIHGSDERLIQTIRWVDKRHHPAAIAVVASAITAVIGLDIDGICRKIQPEISAQLIPFPSGGFSGTYYSGIVDASRSLIDTFLPPGKPVEPKYGVNIIGPSGEEFNIASDYAEICRLLGLMGVRVNTIFPRRCSTRGIAAMPKATINLVTRDMMIPVAEHVRERCGLDWYAGLPMGIRGTMDWIRDVSSRLGLPYPDRVVAKEVEIYAFTLPELFSRVHAYEDFSAVIACPFEYAYGLSRIVTGDWGLGVRAVVLPEEPRALQYEKVFSDLGIGKVLIKPSETEFCDMIRSEMPTIIFGNTFHLNASRDVPLHIHAAAPTPDLLTMYDGMPYTGFRGYAYLTQRLVNEAIAHPEVFRR